MAGNGRKRGPASGPGLKPPDAKARRLSSSAGSGPAPPCTLQSSATSAPAAAPRRFPVGLAGLVTQGSRAALPRRSTSPILRRPPSRAQPRPAPQPSATLALATAPASGPLPLAPASPGPPPAQAPLPPLAGRRWSPAGRGTGASHWLSPLPRSRLW
jgi:hypothetical protein